MQQILKRTAIQNNVHETFLEFIGCQNESRTVGKILYHFNIQDPAHPRFRSTVTFMEVARPSSMTGKVVAGRQ
ncbi:hypothetical protein [uncultured Desulfosarcina sp.]|uniref:hypothetical protein n=1 Tax=uncultured Desulfosarcina sp. TaxID=218289 RepID=UPI0029C8EA39|nr:hypothetical protein [uncultured Desulfosarcina sp.]